MLFGKKSYFIQTVFILAIFFFVLFALVFRLIIDLRAESIKKQTQQIETQRLKQQFIANIDDQYNRLLKLYNAKEYEKAIEIIKKFNAYEKSDYQNLSEIKKQVRLYYLKKKLEFIPKIHFDEFMKLSKDISLEDDNSTEVFIRTPRYGQYFNTSDLPILLEGVALSVAGDFSDSIVWKSLVDGELGKGNKIAVHLSVGEHQITATATNGITKGSMTTRIFIEKDPDFLKYYRKK
ncbi:hypothetical protein [Desulfobacula toluolica]|uniref:Conserved uncharacterized protein n=1 Tax=Desulfobacula toluolica (strain DSM 7467 / Tol2) TaxID=651182 RepID=K0NAL2_DESTT|nr:hypothetical protein [Desulfobacula toluolica]CCK81099.1 conserved uncharacterized protein [Desulfobacula toluolica Tol2]